MDAVTTYLQGHKNTKLVTVTLGGNDLGGVPN